MPALLIAIQVSLRSVLRGVRRLIARLLAACLKSEPNEYAALFHFGNDSIFVIQGDNGGVPGPIVEVNDAACAKLGYAREELLGRRLTKIHPPAQSGVLGALARRLAEGGDCVLETQHLARDGRLIPTEIDAKRIEWRGQEMILVVARDMTERKKAEARLLASERRDRRYLERSAAGFIRTSLDGRMLDCNDAVARFLGYDSPEELSRRRVPDLYYDPNERRQVLAALREHKILSHRELSLRRKDGSRLWALANLTLVTEEDSGTFIEGSLVDITDRKEMEQKLRATASVVEASPNFVCYVMPDGEATYVNPAGRRLLGLPEPDPRTGQMGFRTMFEDFLCEQDRTVLRNVALPSVARDGEWAGEMRLRNWETGETIPVWQSLFYIKDEGSESNGRVALATIARDLRNQKLHERELRKAKEEAEAGNLAKSRFLANMSHEIRTPLNGILGMARVLLASELNGDQRRYAEIVVSSGENLLLLVNQILDLSKIEAGKIVLENAGFELAEIMGGVMYALDPEARRKRLEFKCEMAPDVPRLLRGDPLRLRQVITNLAGNAIKFTEAGRVALSVSKHSIQNGRTTLRFVVEDTGVGIPPERASALFSRFVQADESTTRRFGGTGLGLAISKQLVELMGGEIAFESSPGRGTRFEFTANFEIDGTPAPKSPGARFGTSTDHSGGRGSGRILVAEDNPVNREVMLAFLRQLGYRADAAPDGAEAVKALETSVYDLVLMDCQMPRLDGYEATRTIRRSSAGTFDPEIPIVAVTAGAMPGDRERCLEAGMNDYLSKPIDAKTLERVLDRWLSKALQNPPARSVEQENSFAEISSEPAPTFDCGRLMRRLMGNQRLAHRALSLFLDSAPLQISSLRRHTEIQDSEKARREAHTLKGGAATISAPSLENLAREAERAAANQRWDCLDRLLPDMEQQLERLRWAIEDWEREEQTGPSDNIGEGFAELVEPGVSADGHE